MNNYILYYYLREDFSSPFYVGYGRPRRINSRHSRRNGAEIPSLNVVEEDTEESYAVPSGRYDHVYSMGTI